MEGQIIFHIVTKRMSGFVYILACCRKDLRLLRRVNITKFLYMRIA